MPPECLYKCIRQKPPRNCENNVASLAYDTPIEGIPSGSYLVWKTRIVGIQSPKGRMMIDSIVWAQHISVAETQTATQTATLLQQ